MSKDIHFLKEISIEGLLASNSILIEIKTVLLNPKSETDIIIIGEDDKKYLL